MIKKSAKKLSYDEAYIFNEPSSVNLAISDEEQARASSSAAAADAASLLLILHSDSSSLTRSLSDKTSDSRDSFTLAT